MPTNTKTILVIGGAGYIGAHMVLMLRKAGYQVVVLDNLSKGHAAFVQDAKLIIGDVADTHLLSTLFTQYHFTAVIHFAAFIEVAESVHLPGKYYENNVFGTLQLIKTMLKYNVNHLIFSSTAAVYGDPLYTPINESHPLNPMNPYGRSKWMAETIIKDFAESNALQFAILRYFNAAGSDPEAKIIECHKPETHLIPLVLQTAKGTRKKIIIYGNDYATQDGTCIRDYIHVSDLCHAHLLALKYLSSQSQNLICNLGTGRGHSVAEVIDIAANVTGLSIPVEIAARRKGDPAILVADPSYAKSLLNWQPQYADLTTIIRHAWDAINHNH